MMCVNGSGALAVLKAARDWQEARMAAIQAPVDGFAKDKKGDSIPVPNPKVWADLGAAETALSAAVTQHRAADLVWDQGASEEVVEQMRAMSPDDRSEVLGHFCSSCGSEQDPDSRCQCWNDE